MAGSRNDASSTDDGERGPPRSRVEPFAHLLGVETDAEVARRAGVSPETARIYRVRHGISSASSRRGEWHAASERERSALPPEPTAPQSKGEKRAPDTAQPAAGSERPFRRGGQASPIDAHYHILGKVSDSEVARLAEVSTAAVSQYRRRRGIPSSVAGGGSSQEAAPVAAPVAVAPPAPVAASVAQSAPVAQPAPAAPAPRAQDRSASRSIAWLVVVQRGGAEESYIVVGTDVSDAAARAVRLVDAGSEVISVTRHMDALV